MKEYQKVYLEIYDEGYNRGIQQYELGYSRQTAYRFIAKTCPYKSDREFTDYIEGFMDGYEYSEINDYTTNITIEDYKD